MEVCPGVLGRLRPGSNGDLLFKTNRGLIECKAATATRKSRQFTATMNSIRSHKTGAALLDVYEFNEEGQPDLLIRILILMVDLNGQLNIRDVHKSTIHPDFCIIFSMGNLAFNPSTAKILGNAVVWRKGEDLKDWSAELEIMFPSEGPRVEESDWITRSNEVIIGDHHEDLVESFLLPKSLGLVKPDIASSSFEDHIFQVGDGLVTVQTKTIHSVKTNRSLRFPTNSRVDGVQNTPYTLERCCDLIVAVWAGDFSPAWNAPADSLFALVFFSKQEVCKGKSSFTFQAGQHLHKTVFLNKHKVQIGHAWPAVLSTLGFM